MRAALVHFVADIMQTLAVLVAAIIVKIWVSNSFYFIFIYLFIFHFLFIRCGIFTGIYGVKQTT